MTTDTQDEQKDALQETGQPSESEVDAASEEKTWTNDEVRFMAELHARDRHGTLDKEIAVRDKYLGLAAKEKEQHARVQEENRSLKEAEDKRREAAAKGDVELYDVESMRRQLDADKRELETSREAHRWEQLEHQELFEKANALSALEALDSVVKEFDLTNEQKDQLFQLGAKSPDEMKVYAQNFAKINLQAKPSAPKPDSGVSSGGSSKSWDKIKDDYAHGRIKIDAYEEAREKYEKQ